MFFWGNRSVQVFVDEILAFLRPSQVHVREERERLELTRDEDGDAAPGLGGDARGIRVQVPDGYEAPQPRRPHVPPRDSQGLVV